MTTTQKWLALSAALIIIGLLWYYFIYNPPASASTSASPILPNSPGDLVPGTASDPGTVINTNKPVVPTFTNKPVVGI